MQLRIVIFLCACFSCFGFAAQAQQANENTYSYDWSKSVHDSFHQLAPEDKQRLETRVAAFRQFSNAEVILIVEDTVFEYVGLDSASQLEQNLGQGLANYIAPTELDVRLKKYLKEYQQWRQQQQPTPQEKSTPIILILAETSSQRINYIVDNTAENKTIFFPLQDSIPKNLLFDYDKNSIFTAGQLSKEISNQIIALINTLEKDSIFNPETGTLLQKIQLFFLSSWPVLLAFFLLLLLCFGALFALSFWWKRFVLPPKEHLGLPSVQPAFRFQAPCSGGLGITMKFSTPEKAPPTK